MTNIRKLKYLFFETPYIFFLIYSFFIMLFFTQSSPLFKINLWVDSNAFFTVGKAMANGMVTYRDIFEQKGPLLYFLHAIAYMISHTSFLGVYILESAAMFINLYFVFKISRLYLNWMPSVIVAILFPLLILNQNSFIHGDSAEEFSIPFLLASLFIIFNHFRNDPDSPFKWIVFLLNGIFIGCVFWIKFTLVGGWIGFYLAVFFISVINKRWKELGNAILFTLAGLFISTIPWLLYFGINHAIKDLIDVYLKFNLFTYPSQTSLIGKLINSAVIFGRALNGNFENMVLIIVGLIAFMFSGKYLVNTKQKLMVFLTFIFLILGVYFGGRESPYYFLIITPFGLLGLIVIAKLFNTSSNVRRPDISSWFSIFLIAFAAFYLCFGFNSNIKVSSLYVKEPLVQEAFAKIMRAEPNPTLLNYGALDGGFYLAADILPNVRYFEAQNVDYNLYPENIDEQQRYIKEGKVQFVVVRIPGQTPAEKVSIPHLRERYSLVSEKNQLFGNIEFKYLLYKKVK